MKKYGLHQLYRWSRNYNHSRKYGKRLPSGFTDNQTWGALHKCWIGYIIAKNKCELDKQVMYAERIQKLEKELEIDITDFSNLGIYADTTEEDSWFDDGQDEDDNAI